MAKKFEEMTKEERMKAFEEWSKKRDDRKGQSKIKRTATRKLIELHQDEYNALVVQLGGKGKAAA